MPDELYLDCEHPASAEDWYESPGIISWLYDYDEHIPLDEKIEKLVNVKSEQLEKELEKVIPQIEPYLLETDLEKDFQALAQRWHKETRYLSTANKMAMHPAYQKIISLGKDVIPLILRDLQRTRGHWLWALYILSDFQDPAPEAATFDEAVDAWLNWGKQHEHI